MVSYPIRVFGDPVLKRPANDVTNVDGAFVGLVDAMFDAMYAAPGIGLAAPQVGIEQRFFVYDVDDDPTVLLNPTIVESEGESVYEEGCLSIPGCYFEIVRPAIVTVQGIDLEGNEVVVRGEDLLSRCLQHEIDHLDGVLLFDRMERDERKRALKQWREQGSGGRSRRSAL